MVDVEGSGEDNAIPVMELEVKTQEGEANEEHLAFSWNVTEQSNNTLYIQLFFEEAEYVSMMGADADTLIIHINDPYLFIGTQGATISDEDRAPFKSIPT